MSDNPTRYGLNDGSKPIQYSANDWFYLKTGVGSKCEANGANGSACIENKKKVQDLITKTDVLGTAITQYNDIQLIYNRELLFTINIFFGLAMLVYYVYVNGDALPKLSDAAKKIGSVGNSMTQLATSAANKLPIPAMRPPAQ